MTETTEGPAVPEFEPWLTAVDAVLEQFVAYSTARMRTGDLEECRLAAGVSEATAELFEGALDRVCPDEETTTETEAVPAGATAETAPTAHETP